MLPISQAFYSGGVSGYSVSTQPVTVTTTPISLPTPSSPFPGSPPTTSVGPEPTAPAPSVTLPGTTSTTQPSANDPITALLNSILGPGAASSSGPAQITTIQPTPTASAGMSKTWLLVGAIVLIGGIAWYVMKHKKAGSNASA